MRLITILAAVCAISAPICANARTWIVAFDEDAKTVSIAIGGLFSNQGDAKLEAVRYCNGDVKLTGMDTEKFTANVARKVYKFKCLGER